ncbi:MAG: hypothetical protein SGI97_02755 [candidate division Zixibacteria bacterium]|nr:hypothetical protein [candidate division Zixibacteria bacterium]
MNRLLALVFGLTIILSVDVLAEKPFVSFNGKFYFNYPDNWQQVDYRTVDYFLSQGQSSQQAFNYEAVFAPDTLGPFFEREYLIVTLDTIGMMSQQRIDSVLGELNDNFGDKVKYAPVGNYMTDLRSNAPVYDQSTQTVSILTDVTDITDQGSVLKKNLLVLKFYERGIANFYFYASDSIFSTLAPTFKNIVASFSSENVESATPKETVKIGNVDVKSKKSPMWLFWVPIVIVLGALLVIFKKRRRTS